MKRHWIFGIALALAAAGCGGGETGPIYLGLAAPVGLDLGRGALQGALLAVEEINADGGIHGRMIELDVKDDRMERERAIQVATEFRDEGKVAAVIGHVNSGATLAAADIYNHPTNGLLEISPGSSSPELSGRGEWTFRVCPSDLDQGAAVADWAYHQMGLRRAAVLYSNDEYGRGVVDAFVPSFERLGGTVVARDPYLSDLMDSDTTLDPYLIRAMNAGMDALVIVGIGEEAHTILRAARRLGYRGAVMGTDGITDLKSVGPIADGVIIATGYLPDRPTEAAQAFAEKYVARFNEAPRDAAAHAYDAVKLVAQGIREVGTDRRALRDYVASVGTAVPAYEGVTGAIGFDENGDAVGKEVVIGVVRDGQLVTARP